MPALLLSLALSTAPQAAISFGAFASRPLSLSEGLSRGPAAGLELILGDFVIDAGARMGFADASDVSYRVAHLELVGTGALSFTHRAGNGSIGLGLLLAPALVRSVRERHQSERLLGQVIATDETSVGFGASLGAIARISAPITKPFGVLVVAGPTIDWVGASDPRIGWSGQLMVSYQLSSGAQR
ncbi:MAG: hypothetical protein HYV07_28945 [Deltaproteobacteria bacterium]|nr:hypothetical protein [Deltaproteobacteria bacterium]